MLILLLRISLWLTLCFALIGGLLSREWGWSEYASDELYVVYFQYTDRKEYFIVNTDDTAENTPLRWNGETITAMDCSPDGRRLAFLTEAARLVVLTRAGIDYEKAVPPDYHHNINVANNGRVAVSEQWQDDLLIDATEVLTVSFPKSDQTTASVGISSQGLALFEGDMYTSTSGIHLVSLPNLEPLLRTYDSFDVKAEWLASEEIFAYVRVRSSGNLQLFWVDATRHEKVAPPDRHNIFSTVLSPDATKLVFSDGHEDPGQLYMTDVLANPFYDPDGDVSHFEQLTHNEVDSNPICFLTFRPEMLLDSTP